MRDVNPNPLQFYPPILGQKLESEIREIAWNRLVFGLAFD